MAHPPPGGHVWQQWAASAPPQQLWGGSYPQQAGQQSYQPYAPQYAATYAAPPQQFLQVQNTWYQAASQPAVAPPSEPQPPLPDEPPPLPTEEPPTEAPPLPGSEPQPQPQPEASLPAEQQAHSQLPGQWHNDLRHQSQTSAANGWHTATAPWQADYSAHHPYASPYQYGHPAPPYYSQQQPAGAPPTSSAVPPPWQQQQQHPSSEPQAPYSPQKSPTPPLANTISAADFFLPPGRSRRPKRLVLVLRGLPGSGKTHTARKLREIEAQHGADALRIHGIDDYFVTEVEKEVPVTGSKGKRQRTTEMEYCFEPELEGRYKQSLFKAYKRTIEEARFRLVVVDAPNAKVDDFKDYWTTGQTCFKRNTHARTLDDINAMAAAWDPCPVAYPQIDFAPLLQSTSKPAEADIAEVEMEMEEGNAKAADALGEDSEIGSASAPRKVASRWHQSHGDIEEQDAVRVKKQRRKAAPPADLTQAAAQLKPILKSQARHSSDKAKGVSWADQSSLDIGFAIGGASRQQLETVYVLEGLGPPPADKSTAGSDGPTFADQAKQHRTSEQQLFRSLLLGGSRK